MTGDGPVDDHGSPADAAPTAAVLRGRAAASLGGDLARMLGPLTGDAVVCARLSAPTPATPPVVHAVVDTLVRCGADEVTVGTTLHAGDRDRGHRSVGELAQLAGLTGRTPSGRRYAVVDLGQDVVTAPVPATSVLHGQPVSRLWASAGTRVVIGRAVTDLLQEYAGALDALSGACPEVPGADPADVVAALMRDVAPRVTVIDAIVTAGGADGARLPDPVQTDTVVIADDPLLADCTLAGLLGVDRSSSPLVRRAVADLGLPAGRVLGDLTPFPSVTGPHPLARRAARDFARGVRQRRVLTAAIGGPDQGAQADDSVLTALRSVLTPAVAAAADPVGQAALAGLLGAAGAATAAHHAWSVALNKAAVTRRVVGLGFDPDAYPGDAYHGLPAFFAPFDAAIDALPDPGPDALRWTLLDGATVFECARDIAAGFDDFVARVDVAEGIGLMADYLGGRRVTTGHPEAAPGGDGTVRVPQAERNLYLPQPNYLAAWGGEPIDVCKIELVERGPDRHRLWWRTIASPNGSASYDDGNLTFTRAGSGVRATVRGRQLFTLPPFWAAVDLTQLPEWHGPLLEDAYRRFFTTTFDNLEARFEGREFRIGRPPADPDEPLATALLQLLLDAAVDWVKSRAGTGSGSAGSRESPAAPAPRIRRDEPGELDGQGFRHVRGTR